MTDEPLMVGVECGVCAGPVYFEVCEVEGHDWAVATECQRCGLRVDTSGCHDCESAGSAS